jgi:gamma-glutamyl:cysteine ligase YbdK (ATP-grasp superfamily)
LRPHPFFPTLEFRVCDIPTRVDDTVAVAALFQAIVAKLNLLMDKNLSFRLYHRRLIQENKWRAVRWGLQGKMLDLGKRSEVFKKFPRTDIPDHFDSYATYQRYVDLLISMNCIDNAKKIYWDLRPHPFFPTLEFRVCDIPTRVDDTVAVAALFQAIVAKLNLLMDKNLSFRLYHRRLIQENKWRAVRWGLQGKMLDLGKQKEVPAVDLIRELLDFVDDVLDDLGSRKEVEHIHTIIERGTSADEQLKVWEENNQKDLLGFAPASVFSDPRVSRLRHSDAG